MILPPLKSHNFLQPGHETTKNLIKGTIINAIHQNPLSYSYYRSEASTDMCKTNIAILYLLRFSKTNDKKLGQTETHFMFLQTNHPNELDRLFSSIQCPNECGGGQWNMWGLNFLINVLTQHDKSQVT